MRGAWRKLPGMARRFWMQLREWCGDASYERYLRAAHRKNAANLATPEQFYIEQLERRYSKPNRCC